LSVPRQDIYIAQAANILQLFTFIKHDLAAYRPRAESGLADALSSGFDPVDELSFPKSLYLIRPLVSSYELGPVAAAAQASVPLPDGLDLDAWIVPAMQEPLLDDESQMIEKKRKEDPLVDELAPQEQVETAEERAERERVGSACAPVSYRLTQFIIFS